MIEGTDNPRALKHLEIFPVLPVGDLRQEARHLGVLDLQDIIDERLAELVLVERARPERVERLHQADRQLLGLRLIGRVGHGRWHELALDAVEPTDQLRVHGETGVGRRLADAVLGARAGSPAPRATTAGAESRTSTFSLRMASPPRACLQ
jgi:hypothetical protein